jgi:hypothetical protein
MRRTKTVFKKRFLVILSLMLILSLSLAFASAYEIKTYYAETEGRYFTNIYGVRNTIYFDTRHNVLFTPTSTTSPYYMYPMTVNGFNVQAEFSRLADMWDYTQISDYLDELRIKEIYIVLGTYNESETSTVSNIYGVSDGLNISVYLAARSGNEKTTIQLYVAMTPSNVLWDPSDILTSRSVLTEVYYR